MNNIFDFLEVILPCQTNLIKKLNEHGIEFTFDEDNGPTESYISGGYNLKDGTIIYDFEMRISKKNNSKYLFLVYVKNKCIERQEIEKKYRLVMRGFTSIEDSGVYFSWTPPEDKEYDLRFEFIGKDKRCLNSIALDRFERSFVAPATSED